MKAEWPELSLEDVSELIVDCPHSTPEWTDDGVIVLRNQYIRNGRLDLSNPSYTNEEGYQARIKRAIPTAGDLVITREAPMGEVCLIPEGLRCCLGQRMVLVRANNKIIDPKYLLFVIQSPYLKHQISWNEGTGTTVSNIRIPNLKAFLIPTPPLDEQKAIAHILGTLDDKIELNRQMNQTLEEMAQALFKSWFVDFDPVIDNALAAGNEIPEPLQKRAVARQALGDQRKPLPSDIQSLFPDSFVFTEEMGWIPEGWRTDSLGNHLYIKGRIGWKGLKRSEYLKEDTGYFIVNGSDFTDEQIDWDKGGWIPRERYDESPEIQLKENDILITKDGTIGKLAFVHKLKTKTSVASGIFVVRANSELLTTFFCWMFFKSPYFQVVVKSKIDGSVIPHLYQRDFVEMFIPLPQSKIIEFFESRIESIYKKVFSNKEEMGELSNIRDTLLPKLLSGELLIPKAEKQVEEAV